MADYTQPEYVDRRVRFFNNQFLVEQDLIDEQKYHIDRERRLIKNLYTPGIVAGLELTVSDAAIAKIAVAPGTALDDRGRQIVLSEGRSFLLSVGDFTVDHGADVLPFQPENSQPTLWLVISYAEVESDLARVGSQGSTRWQENPAIALMPKGSPDLGTVHVVLGRLSLSISSDNKVTINDARPDDQKVRAYAGLRLRGLLTVDGNIGVGTSTPVAPLEIRNPETNSDDTGQILKDPTAILRLYREGVPGKSWPDIAQLSLSRYANPDPNAKTQLDIGLTNGADNAITPIMSLRGDGNLAIGTTTAPATLTVNGSAKLTDSLTVSKAASDANGGDLYLGGDRDTSHLRLGHHGDYSWVQSHGSKPLAINPLGNNVGIGTTTPGATLDVRSLKPNFDNGVNTKPESVLRLYREGVFNRSWPNIAELSLSRYANPDTSAKTQLDVNLSDGNGTGTQTVMSLRGDGTISFALPPFKIQFFNSGDNADFDTGQSYEIWGATAIIGFETVSNGGSVNGMRLTTYIKNGTWWIRADLIGVNESWPTIQVMFIRKGWVN